jgi:hypothetical protein
LKTRESKETAEATWLFEARIFQLFDEYAHFRTVSRMLIKNPPPFATESYFRLTVALALCEF